MGPRGSARHANPEARARLEVEMHKQISLVFLMLFATSLPGEAGEKKAVPKILTGVIKKFECGDNCYLTIATSGGEETGLCEAKACVPWFENQTMPKKFIGKKVMVTTGVGKQVDGNYTVVGQTLSFKKLEFVK
jgi:hypothetical protein